MHGKVNFEIIALGLCFFYQQVKVTPLSWNERYYLPQETGNYSVAGFKLNMERKMTHYVITYYLPSGLFVVVSWASFLIPSDDIQVKISQQWIKHISTNFLNFAAKSCQSQYLFWLVPKNLSKIFLKLIKTNKVIGKFCHQNS